MIVAAMLITLVWKANTEPDLAGYNIWQGGASETYTNRISAGLSTTNKLDLAPGKYFFAVTAFNTSGAESDFSNEVSVDVIKAADPAMEIKATEFPAIGLSWPAVGGAVYQVESAWDVDCSLVCWSPRSPEMTLAGDGTMKWAEACEESDRFYRVVRLR